MVEHIKTQSRLDIGVLVLDDQPMVVEMLRFVLEREGANVMAATSIGQAEAMLGTTTPEVAIVDVFLNKESGLTFARALRDRIPDMGIVVISAEDTEALARKALESGADNFLSKPIVPSALILAVSRLRDQVAERRRAMNLEMELRQSLQNSIFPEIVTNSDAMLAVLRLVEKVGPRDLSVLVCGDSGTGKELIASAIHQSSRRSKGPFVELNCAALPPNLVESELFGHEKGSFTGAIASRPGKIRQASGGTLFLDEIGELPLEIQPKLLRALQEKTIVPVGGKEAVACDFRLISATNRDLVEEVRAGRFREDLFYRVAVFPIQLPSLRERIEDLQLLLDHFLRMEGISRPRITQDALAILTEHPWPGNVRELKNFAQAITLYADGGLIEARHVQEYFGTRLGGLPAPVAGGTPGRGASPGEKRPVRALADLEREEIVYSLSYYAGNVAEAARALGMGRATLYKYLKRHNIEPMNAPRQS